MPVWELEKRSIAYRERALAAQDAEEAGRVQAMKRAEKRVKRKGR